MLLNALIIVGLVGGALLWNCLRKANSELEQVNCALRGETGSEPEARWRLGRDFLQPWATPAALAALLLCGVCVEFALVQPPAAAAVSLVAANPLRATVVEPKRVLALADAEPAAQISVPDPVFPPSPARTAGDCSPLSLGHARKIARTTSQAEGVSAALILAVIYQESRFLPCAISSSGAQGLMQLKPGTALDVGVTNPFDPVDNIGGGARYLRFLLDRYEGDTATALRAYLNGPGTVDRRGEAGYVSHTEDYVDSIMGIADVLGDD